jgi:putative SOS response-associated peptidase YedK
MDETDGEMLRMMRWGLIPPGSKPVDPVDKAALPLSPFHRGGKTKSMVVKKEGKAVPQQQQQQSSQQQERSQKQEADTGTEGTADAEKPQFLPKLKFRLDMTTINARSDRLESSRLWRPHIQRRRCAIFLDCFYEWRRGDKEKQPHLIRRAGGDGGGERPLLAFAGIYAVMRGLGRGGPGSAEEDLYSVAVVTRDAGQQVMQVHHRQPVILQSPGEIRRWIDVRNNSFESVRPLLRPRDETAEIALEIFPCNRAVNNWRNNGKELWDRAKRAAPPITDFFKPVPKKTDAPPPLLPDDEDSIALPDDDDDGDGDLGDYSGDSGDEASHDIAAPPSGADSIPGSAASRTAVAGVTAASVPVVSLDSSSETDDDVVSGRKRPLPRTQQLVSVPAASDDSSSETASGPDSPLPKRSKS